MTFKPTPSSLSSLSHPSSSSRPPSPTLPSSSTIGTIPPHPSVAFATQETVRNLENKVDEMMSKFDSLMEITLSQRRPVPPSPSGYETLSSHGTSATVTMRQREATQQQRQMLGQQIFDTTIDESEREEKVNNINNTQHISNSVFIPTLQHRSVDTAPSITEALASIFQQPSKQRTIKDMIHLLDLLSSQEQAMRDVTHPLHNSYDLFFRYALLLLRVAVERGFAAASLFHFTTEKQLRENSPSFTMAHASNLDSSNYIRIATTYPLRDRFSNSNQSSNSNSNSFHNNGRTTKPPRRHLDGPPCPYHVSINGKANHTAAECRVQSTSSASNGKGKQ